MKDEEKKNQTIRWMPGEWRAMVHGSLFEIAIDKKQVCIEVNGVQMDCFSIKGRWVGEYYTFDQSPQHFVTFADERRLEFGATYSNSDGFDGNISWSTSLARTKQVPDPNPSIRVVTFLLVYPWYRLRKRMDRLFRRPDK